MSHLSFLSLSVYNSPVYLRGKFFFVSDCLVFRNNFSPPKEPIHRDSTRRRSRSNVGVTHTIYISTRCAGEVPVRKGSHSLRVTGSLRPHTSGPLESGCDLLLLPILNRPRGMTHPVQKLSRQDGILS